jgi:hypothetical protein
VFDIGHWHGIILFALVEFRDLTAFTQDEEAVLTHVDRRGVRHFTENGEEVVIDDPQLNELFRQEVLRSVTQSHRTHLQLLLVYIAAVIERILDDFLMVSFIAHPDWMYDYLRLTIESEIKGVVTLKDVVSTGSKDELIQRLARRAADNANRGTFTDRLKRIEKLSGFSFSNDRVKDLTSLASKRNNLVHELHLDPVPEKEVEGAFDLALALLKDLGHAAEKASLPYEDPSGLLV